MSENIQDIYPLSPMQQGMLFHCIYTPGSEVYTEQLSCTLKGKLDATAFHEAWKIIISRHDILRTAFVWEDLDEPLQVVYNSVELPFEVLDWSDKPGQEVEGDYAELREAERKRGLELNEAPLTRIILVKLSDTEHYFIWNHHHLLMDGWGSPILLKEFFQYYDGALAGLDITLPKPRPFSDYIAWLQQQDMNAAETYWRERLRGVSAPTPLTVDLPAGVREPGYSKERHTFSKELTQALNNLAKDNRITLNTIVQGAWALLLARYSGEDDVIFGSTVSGRPPEITGIESMVGLFINTLPVRVSLNDDISLIEWLKEIQISQAETRQYEYSPLVKIQGWSEIPRHLPLFKSILVFENYPTGDSIGEQQEASLTLSEVHSFEQTNYPLTLAVAPGEILGMDIAYETHQFDKNIITRMFEHIEIILNQMTRDPQSGLMNFPLITRKERQQLQYDWNATETPFPDTATLNESFEKRAAKTPENIALVFGEESITYRELNEQANQIAHLLRSKGVKADTIVGISLTRSMEMLISVIAILKAGGAYLPIDSENPEERRNYMIEDSGMSIILTDSTDYEAIDILVINPFDTNSYTNFPKTNPENIVHPLNLAYIIYTSGSTGKPKGVSVQHQGICNLTEYIISLFKMSETSRILQFITLSFDASVADIFPGLFSGAQLHIVSREEQLSPEKLIQRINNNKVTITVMTPSLLNILPPEQMGGVRFIATGGDVCSWDLATRFAEGQTYINGYGPTETSVGCSYYTVEKKDELAVTVPIGKPLNNTKMYLLDKHLNPVPVGVPGELFIGGIGVTRGYHNRPELTAEKFIPNPYSDKPGERFYRTGDLVRHLPDGNIEFIGRLDFQVKIRGFRIELGEIEAELLKNPQVKNAVVLTKANNGQDKYIVAYIVPAEGETIDINTVRSSIQQNLPDYMIPAAFITLDSLPTGATGKIDRKALPAPDQSDIQTEHYTAPRTPEEELIASIWADVLQLERVGIDNSFFELGGHSLLATQVISRIRDAFDVDIELRHLFETPTIMQIADEINKIKKGEAGISVPPISQADRRQSLPLSFAQQRLWFLDQLQPNSPAYNIPSALKLNGELDIKVLEKSICTIIERHESFRTTFSDIEGKPIQIIAEQSDFELDLIDLSPLNDEDRANELNRLVAKDAQSTFNLASGPLFQAVLIKLQDDEHALLFNMHHIISDGWSIGIMIREMIALYSALSNDKPSPLPGLDIQYPDFAYWQQNWLQGEVLQNQVDYWKTNLAGAPPLLELPIDRPRPAMQTTNGATEDIELTEGLTSALNNLMKEQGVTSFMMLLAAFHTLLHRYSGQDEIVVGSPIANRTNSDIEKIIGFFVNTLIFKGNLSDNPEFVDLLSQVRETALGAYSHQDIPFEKLVEELQPERDMSHSPLFQVAFVFQNIPANQSVKVDTLTMEPIQNSGVTAKYDLTLTMTEAGDKIIGSMEYNTDLFDKETIHRILNHYQTILEAVTNDPEIRIGQIKLIEEAEEKLLLEEWNESKAEFPSEICVHQVFEEFAESNPDMPALIFQENAASSPEQLSYSQLNIKANQLAHGLIAAGVQPENTVGICMNRSLNMVISMLAVLKSGAAYVPIDPAYPQERIEYMIEDSGLTLLLAQKNIRTTIEKMTVKSIFVDGATTELNTHPQSNPGIKIQDANLAYIIYTSGSTGKPKGTLLHHRGAVNLAYIQREAFKVGPGSKILQFASLSFDAATWEFLMAMLSGSTLVLTSNDTITDGQALSTFLAEMEITTITLPPSVLSVLPQTQLSELNTIITAGESVSAELVEQWSESRRFFNAYGPTETTVCASMHECRGSYLSNPPIGKPNQNFKLYVLDQYMNPCPIGVPGELCVSGDGVARGYHNRPGLTAEKFIPNKFSDIEGNRLYRTGDLVRYLPDGNIEYLGRIDQQVKIRGFRIELGEIEAAISKHENIKDQLVIAHKEKDGDKRLVGYIIPDVEKALDQNQLKEYLRGELPEYMVPSAFVFLEAFPLTPNGKINRNALPAPELSRDDLSSEYIAPRNEAEEKIVAIVAELLNIEQVGIHDNFFELGGHSLLATQFMSRLKSAFNVELSLRILFEKPSAAQIAVEVEASKGTETSPSATPKIKRVSRSAKRVKRSDLD